MNGERYKWKRIAGWRLLTGLILFAALHMCTIGAADAPADLVLRGGKVVTVDSAKPLAAAIAARGSTIAAVGSDAEIERLIGPKTRVIDLAGRLAIPGFIEGHGHLLSMGHARMTLDLSAARRWEEIVALVERAAKDAMPGDWIVGFGWHQGRWNAAPSPQVEGYPVHEALSRVSLGNPVLLKHASGHMSLANARALELARITRNTPDPAGGQIVRDAAGNPTGALRESAQRAVHQVQAAAAARRSAKQREADELKALDLAIRECLAKGVTSFQDAGSSFAAIDRFKRLADEGRLPLRLWVMVRGESHQRMTKKLSAYRMIGYADNRLTVRGIKCMVDGALGTHGAWLIAPYDDLPSSTGLVVETLDSIKATALLAAKYDYQLCTHAIGDRANREILDLYDTTFRGLFDKKDRRWRIEHAQHVRPADFPRFAELGVIASMQGNHAASDGPFVVARLGKKRGGEESFAWRSLLDAGATIINGTDAPVEDVNPILCFHSTVTRCMRDGTQFFPEQCMTRDEALKSYTLDAAFAAFEESLKGSLTAGKLADIVVLSQDIMTVPVEKIPTAQADLTVVGGKIVHERK